MLYAFGIGEVPISISGIGMAPGPELVQTIRAVGAVSPGRSALRRPGTARRRARAPSARTGVSVSQRRAPAGAAAGSGAALSDPAGKDLLDRRQRHRAGSAPARPAGGARRAGRCGSSARVPRDVIFTGELDASRGGRRRTDNRQLRRRGLGWPRRPGHPADQGGDRRPARPTVVHLRARNDDAAVRAGAGGRGVAETEIRVSLERNMRCGVALCGHCQLGPLLLCRDGPVLSYAEAARCWRKRSCDAVLAKTGLRANPTLAVWKLASCDGCQLTLLDCEDELLALAGEVDIAHFAEAPTRWWMALTTSRWWRARSPLSGTPGGSPRSGRLRSSSSASAPAPPRRDTGAAQLRRRHGVHRRGLRAPGLHRDAGDLYGRRRPRPGRFRAARLPDRPATAA